MASSPFSDYLKIYMFKSINQNQQLCSQVSFPHTQLSSKKGKLWIEIWKSFHKFIKVGQQWHMVNNSIWRESWEWTASHKDPFLGTWRMTQGLLAPSLHRAFLSLHTSLNWAREKNCLIWTALNNCPSLSFFPLSLVRVSRGQGS